MTENEKTIETDCSEEIELDAQDEQVLDSVWQELREEKEKQSECHAESR